MGLEKEAKLKITADGSAAEKQFAKVRAEASKLRDLERDTKNDARDLAQVFGEQGSQIGKAAGALGQFKGQALGMGKELAANLAKLALEFADASTGMKAMDFGAAKDRAKKFEDALTRLGLVAGRDLTDLAGEVKGVGVELGRQPEDVVALSRSFGGLTYSAKDSVEAIRQIGDKAQRSGRNVEELMPLGVTMAKSFGTAADRMGEGFERIRQLSGALKTAGGERGFQELVVQLGPQLEMMGLRTDEARNKILAFTGVFAAAGKNPAQAQAFGGQAAGMLGGLDPVLLERTLGYDPYDETGVIKDPSKVMHALYNKAAKRLGGKKGKPLKMALRRQFGTQLGSVIYHGGEEMLNEADRQEHLLNVAGKMQEGGAKYLGQVGEEATPEQRREVEASMGRGGFRNSAAGQRQIREAEKAAVELDVGNVAARNEDAYQDKWKGNRRAQAAFETSVLRVLPARESKIVRAVAGIDAHATARGYGTPRVTPGEQRTHELLQRVVQTQEQTAEAIRKGNGGNVVNLGTVTEGNKAMGARQ